MSIFIKGLNLPDKYPVKVIINPTGAAFVDYGPYFETLEAVNVPATHGPLIDAGELLKWAEVIPLTWDGGVDINDLEQYLKTAPAIIGAEEGENK